MSVGRVLLALWMLISPGLLASTVSLKGKVVDSTGAAIVGARVELAGTDPPRAAITDKTGRFFFGGAPFMGPLRVSAAGFATRDVVLNAAEMEIVLVPAAAAEVTVTASRTEATLMDVPASVNVLDSKELRATPALAVDDALRQVPGFSLFRRTGSRVANPTTQGVSLRGVGASGASRALVLHDGVPLNDPFGGWVYWGRVPRNAIASAEVLHGGGSHLYGSDALGGVVHLRSQEFTSPLLSVETAYGNELTPNASVIAGGSQGRWSGALVGEFFHTDGYRLVREEQRGAVDTDAGSEHKTFEARGQRKLGDDDLVFARWSWYGESRRNGTPLQRNRSRVRQLVLGGEWRSRELGALAVRAFGGTQSLRQSFTAVADDRNSERLTRSQIVPAQQVGYSVLWANSFRTHSLVAGVDGRHVFGHSDETIFGLSGPMSNVDAGGRERSLGVFLSDTIRLHPRWQLAAGGRVDRWKHHDAFSITTPLSAPGTPARTDFAERSETAFSPRVALLHRLRSNVSVSISGYRAFRAPTLNELYRAFRVGDVLTLANDQLRAERLTGAEAGFRFVTRRSSMSGDFFWADITRAIANVTLNVTPALITRQRQNLGRTRSRGFSVFAEHQFTARVAVGGGYLLTDATVVRFPADALLEGLRIPQVPRHQFTLQTRYTNPAWFELGVQGRFSGLAFDDDRNALRLDRFFTADASLSRRIIPGVELFAAAENIFNQRYTVGRTPVETLGPPLLARIGIRLTLPAR